MTLKLLNLNIWKGRFIKEILNFVKENDFDILHFQEVAGGKIAQDEVDCFSVIKKETGMIGVMPKAWHLPGDPFSYFANATFYKSQFNLQKKETIWLYDLQEIEHPHITLGNTPRNGISLLFEIEGKKIYFINTHQAWGPKPVDTPLKLKQGNILYRHIKKLEYPFILSGDFNVTKDSKIIQKINLISENHIKQNEITNTLNPKTHSAQELFPKGLAVDFIFTKDLETKDFKVVDSPTLSDHLGLVIEFNL